MNPHRHTFISTCLYSIIRLPQNANQKGLRYLDIGCGGGIFAESAARLPNTHTVTAIDPTPSVLAVAKEHQRNDPALSPPKLNYLNTAIPSSVLSLHGIVAKITVFPFCPVGESCSFWRRIDGSL